MTSLSPNRFTGDATWAQSMSTLNDNFDKSVQAINDIGGKFFSVATASKTITAGSVWSLSVGFNDTRNQYVASSTPIIPRIAPYVDNDNVDGFQVGWGASLTAGQALVICTSWVYRGSSTGNVAVATFQFHNLDSSSHTIYAYVDGAVFASPQSGYFR